MDEFSLAEAHSFLKRIDLLKLILDLSILVLFAGDRKAESDYSFQDHEDGLGYVTLAIDEVLFLEYC